MGVEMARGKVIEYANAQIDAGVDTEYWQGALDWYASIPLEAVGTHPHVQHYEYVNEMGGYWYNEEFVFANPAFILSWETHVLDLLTNLRCSETTVDFHALKPYSDRMSEITLPTLVLWGRHDGILPVEMGQSIYEQIGTSPAEKQIQIFENSAHNPYIEEQSAFNEVVVAYLRSL